MNIRGNDSEEQKKRLEKKRGMKLDDHPQFKKEETEVEEGIDFKGAKRIDDARKDLLERRYIRSLLLPSKRT